MSRFDHRHRQDRDERNPKDAGQAIVRLGTCCLLLVACCLLLVACCLLLLAMVHTLFLPEHPELRLIIASFSIIISINERSPLYQGTVLRYSATWSFTPFSLAGLEHYRWQASLEYAAFSTCFNCHTTCVRVSWRGAPCVVLLR